MAMTPLKTGLDTAPPVPLHTDFRSGQFEGFEVDLMNEICSSLGYDIQYEVHPRKFLLHKLRKGELDLVCSAVTVTKERQQFLEFSIPYLTFRLCAVVRQDNILTSVAALDQKRIGIRMATESEKFIRNYLPENEVMLSESNDELYRELAARTIDCVIDDAPIASAYLKLNPSMTVGFFLPDTDSGYSIALKKGDLERKRQIDVAIENLRKSDVYAQMMKRWFDNSRLG